LRLKQRFRQPGVEEIVARFHRDRHHLTVQRTHDGSLTNDAAFPVPTLLRSSGLGTWQHTQAQTYTLSFRFFRYNDDGSFAAMRRVAQTLVVNGDQYNSVDRFQDFDLNNNPLPTTGCNIENAVRVQ